MVFIQPYCLLLTCYVDYPKNVKKMQKSGKKSSRSSFGRPMIDRELWSSGFKSPRTDLQKTSIISMVYLAGIDEKN